MAFYIQLIDSRNEQIWRLNHIAYARVKRSANRLWQDPPLLICLPPMIISAPFNQALGLSLIKPRRPLIVKSRFIASHGFDERHSTARYRGPCCTGQYEFKSRCYGSNARIHDSGHRPYRLVRRCMVLSRYIVGPFEPPVVENPSMGAGIPYC